jgi:hypothetical protein
MCNEEFVYQSLKYSVNLNFNGSANNPFSDVSEYIHVSAKSRTQAEELQPYSDSGLSTVLKSLLHVNYRLRESEMKITFQ